MDYGDIIFGTSVSVSYRCRCLLLALTSSSDALTLEAKQEEDESRIEQCQQEPLATWHSFPDNINPNGDQEKQRRQSAEKFCLFKTQNRFELHKDGQCTPEVGNFVFKETSRKREYPREH